MQGRYFEAEPLYKRSLAIWGKALGPEHPDGRHDLYPRRPMTVPEMLDRRREDAQEFGDFDLAADYPYRCFSVADSLEVIFVPPIIPQVDDCLTVRAPHDVY
ncbi:MAG: tetratricopeptide repeat protein [Alphaproteobacteria bacterium]|nr:tetratricopeptide repeat protein [Alphaproteobacteria bacterium]